MHTQVHTHLYAVFFAITLLQISFNPLNPGSQAQNLPLHWARSEGVGGWVGSDFA